MMMTSETWTVSAAEALEHIQQFAVNHSVTHHEIVSRAIAESGGSIEVLRRGIAWFFVAMGQLGGMIGGFLIYHSKCEGFPAAFGVLSKSACLAASVSVSSFLCGSVLLMASAAGIDKPIVSAATNHLERRSLVDYNHYTNLTELHSHWRSQGQETGLYDHDNATYYTDGTYYYGINVTNILGDDQTGKVYLQSGMKASRLFANVPSSETVDENVVSDQVFKAQWCHTVSTPTEKVDFSGEQNAINLSVDGKAGGGKSEYAAKFRELLANVHIDVLNSGFCLNEEWSEESICGDLEH